MGGRGLRSLRVPVSIIYTTAIHRTKRCQSALEYRRHERPVAMRIESARAVKTGRTEALQSDRARRRCGRADRGLGGSGDVPWSAVEVERGAGE